MTKSEHKKVLEAKKEAKEALFKKSYPGTDAAKTPLLLIYGPAKDKEDRLLLELLEGVRVLPVKVIIVDDNIPADAAAKPAGQIYWVNEEEGRNERDLEKYLEAADMALVFDEDHENLKNIMKKGVVIIGSEKAPALENYHPNDETGNAFTFSSYNPWDMFRAIVRATETFRFPYDWENIVRGMFREG